MGEGVVIEGTLVNLRAQEMADLERNHRWLNDREVMRFLGGRYQYSLLAEENWMRERTGRPIAWGPNIGFAIETKDGRHIGNTGLHDASAEDRSADLGIMIGEKECWGRGYGTDALRTLVRFGFDEMNLNRIALDVYDFNERAIASYLKCGFVEEARRRQDIYREGRYVDVVMMSLLREDWERAR
jgi:RimJ/RimL family protein N-acetyltransferase